MKVSKFHLASAGTAGLGLVAAVLALVGLSGPALAVVALAVAALAVALVLADRRATRHRPARVPSGVATSGGDVEARLGALEKRLETMERRLLASLDAARFEEAERRRAGTSG